LALVAVLAREKIVPLSTSWYERLGAKASGAEEESTSNTREEITVKSQESIMLLENWTKICQCRREKWNDAKTETEAIYRRI
jgi:hypothetical protein